MVTPHSHGIAGIMYLRPGRYRLRRASSRRPGQLDDPHVMARFEAPALGPEVTPTTHGHVQIGSHPTWSQLLSEHSEGPSEFADSAEYDQPLLDDPRTPRGRYDDPKLIL